MPLVATVPAAAARSGRLGPLVLTGLFLATLGMLGEAVPGEAGKRLPSRAEQRRFMWAMAGQESGWDYYARNRSSGAYGKYQIMPFNWPAWSTRYLGTPEADQTPWNQEVVAYRRLRDLHRWLGSWRRVAYWWLTGSKEPDERRWSSYARGYVDRIMALRKRAPKDGGRMPRRGGWAASRGDWRFAVGRQKLRIRVAGRKWPARGRIRDGRVLRIRRVARGDGGRRWLRVVTADGRLGWVRRSRTVPARRPAHPRRWDRVRDRGADRLGKDRRRDGRGQARPRPR